MNLKKITSKYTAKCVKCQREIKVGWTVFFDADSGGDGKAKSVYCRPCGIALESKKDGDNVSAIETDTELIKLVKEIHTAVIQLQSTYDTIQAFIEAKKPVKKSS